ncbi:MAG: DegQ family serine endoprotease [Gammaproteobacteria bacterium]|nr:DegQ family serine endoprotease [Gammaproteobacteria bacterium]NIR84321.1 DegQ family serine endoprotease [Gammaproteobacteria bacterium]NIR89837.1 DegQ family serine endoprotease [Gammaproteobacteria bacterium]NIU05704.1 DegQ family serine endoprotease [Gammaproteobacteria bacterium]NIV52464.1 Do family serine endopeptidase [Gammaproteobacteria bacterium]
MSIPAPCRRVAWQRALALNVVLLLATAPVAAQLPDFRPLIQEHSAAVVNISTTRTQATMPQGFEELPEVPEDSPYYPYFEFLRRFFGDKLPEPHDTQSLGSGFIISSDGYLVTNYHVVAEAEEIRVRLADRREFEAELVGGDERSDIALLKMAAEDLPVVKIGKSDELEVGEWVLAIGSPFGFAHSATAGIVSAMGRSLPDANYVPFIQTDVAINPGNSGGPLFNLEGEVVGVNSQIISRTGGFMGVSFAVPIDVAMRVIEQLRRTGYVSRGWLGVLIQDVTRDLAESFGLDRPRGAVVTEVLPNSPAERAGLEVGDIILNFDSEPVAESAELPPLVGMTAPGSRTPVTVLRDEETVTLQVTVDELPEEIETGGSGSEAPGPAIERRLGLAVVDLTPAQREEHRVDHGVLVTAVDEGPARAAGIREGDILLELGGEQVEDSDDLRHLVSELPSRQAVPVLVQREGTPLFFALRVPD